MDLGGCSRSEKSLGRRSRKGVRRKSLRPLVASFGSSLITLAGAPTEECRSKRQTLEDGRTPPDDGTSCISLM